MLSLSQVHDLPVSRNVDVLVVGGGPAGLSAAFASARMGADTLIVEQFNCLGGVAGAGGHGHICLYSAWGSSDRIVGGVTWEIPNRVVDAGFGKVDNSHADFEVEGFKLVLEQMADECNCQLLYHTFFCDSIVEDGKVVGAVIQNKSGRSVIMAKRTVDCTGDGDVAAQAGCRFEQGNPEGNVQPVTLMFTIGGVDWDRVGQFMVEYREKYPDDDHPYKLKEVWKEAQSNGDMRPFQSGIMGWWWTPTRPDQVGINFTHINGIDATSAEDLTAATIEGRKQAYETIDVYRKYIAGMENCYMISTPNTIGIRETRRINGEYCLTKEDIKGSVVFEDSIGYGSFFIDIHGTSGPGMDNRTWYPERGFHYQIPFRITVPVDVDNLLVAGRCACVTHEALGSIRVMPQCGVMGQAAGAASVLSMRSDVVSRNVDIEALQTELRKQECIVSEEDIATTNA